MSTLSRLFLIDDHRVLTDALITILEKHFEIAGAFQSGQDVLDHLKNSRMNEWPHVVVLDISMPDINGIEVARRIKKLLPATAIVFLSMHGETAYVESALQAGGSGYVLKRDAASNLVDAVYAALKGQKYLSASLPPLIPRPRPRAQMKLTARQTAVLEFTSVGKSAKEIGLILGISSKTVEFHKAAVMERLGLHTTAELTRYVMEVLHNGESRAGDVHLQE